MTGVRAEVWGHPIGHSRSPDLHLAGYRHLGAEADYDRRDVTAETLAGEFQANRGSLTGISLTMPLKTDILGIIPDHRGYVDMLNAANTAVKDGEAWWLANTDPIGAAAMVRKLLPHPDATIVLLGAGATARAVVLGLTTTGWVGSLTVVARAVARAQETYDLATGLGIACTIVTVDELSSGIQAGLVISTLPSGTQLDGEVLASLLAPGATLMDVGYHPWPTPLAQAWQDRGLPAYSGLPMLMFQALAQMRAFINGSPDSPLDDEAGVLAAMASAVGLDAVWADPTLMGE